MNIDFIISLLCGTLRTSTPIILAALGQVYTQKSGIMDLSVEGTMVIGCLVGFIAAFFTENLALGLAFAAMAGLVMGLFMAFLSVTVKANQVIAGTALTMFGNRIRFLLVPRGVRGEKASPSSAEFHIH